MQNQEDLVMAREKLIDSILAMKEKGKKGERGNIRKAF